MQYDLVFEGGGAKGMVFVGALEAFEGAELTFRRLLGTSAGAITATLLAAGYDSREMGAALDEEEDGRPIFELFMGTPGPFTEEEVRQSNLAQFLGSISVPYMPGFVERRVVKVLCRKFATEPRYSHVYSAVESGGLYTAERFANWIEQKLNAGLWKGEPRNFGSMNLREFFSATSVELTMVASDTTAGRVLVLNHNTAPDLPVTQAVRMSMSIPFVWPEVEWLKEWGPYRGAEMAGHLIVDGGMLSNFPIELFVSKAPHVVSVMGEGGEGGEGRVLGLLIDESLPVNGAPAVDQNGTGGRLRNTQTAKRIRRLVDTMTQAHDKAVLEGLEDNVVRLPAAGYGTTEFGMSPERRGALVGAGREAMAAYLGALKGGTRGSGTRRGLVAKADRVASRLLE